MHGVLVMNVNFYVTTKEAARFLRSSERTLVRQRAERRGPSYIKEGGRILYSLSRLQEWLDSHEVTPPRNDT